MNSADITRLLTTLPAAERRGLLDSQTDLDLSAVADELHALCFEAWTEEPSRVAGIVEVFDDICERDHRLEIAGHAEWSRGILALVEGRLDDCIEHINVSRQLFIDVGNDLAAAQTQTARLYALGLLGRYDEAVKAGLEARRVFLEHNDIYSAGKIEHNIGNLYWRRDLYPEAEPFLSSAHERFAAIDDQRQLAMVENCQAFVRTLQNDLAGAERLYKVALDRAERNGLTVTRAEIEIGLSNMYLFEGRYDEALRRLESARAAYDSLGLENRSFGCRLESADIYSEIGLLPEAIAAYRGAAEYFQRAGMAAEFARSLLGQARALMRTGEAAAAATALQRAGELYEQEGNEIGSGAARLARAETFWSQGDVGTAVSEAHLALEAFRRGGSERLSFLARWFVADAESGIEELQRVLNDAQGRSREVEFLCRVSLGRLLRSAEHLTAAVNIIEGSRATLAADEVRMAYFSARLIPYQELVKLNLAAGRVDEALVWHERSRARVLADLMDSSETTPVDDAELENLQQQINWFNNRIGHADIESAHGRSQIDDMQASLRDVEHRYQERLRQVMSHRTAFTTAGEFDIGALTEALGHTTLIEYAFIDERLIAFVATSGGVRVVKDLADREDLTADVRRFLFQLQTGRTAAHMGEPARKASHERRTKYARRLFETLIAPLQIESTAIVIVPAGPLHQLPFGALWNGNKFFIEDRIISYAPSSLLLQHVLDRPGSVPRKAVIVSVPEQHAPMIEQEASDLAKGLDDPIVLEGADATIANLTAAAASADIVHLACHGRFRADNPAFSSLQLAENVAFRDLRTLRLKSSIMVLSACESGLNAVDAGNDLVGLTSAFFAAGASTLVMSLWRVDDAAALRLMQAFYSRLQAGYRAAEALTDAQRQLIAAGMHPYFWSQFIVSGRG